MILLGSARPFGFPGAVSYTHLDVYKRQEWYVGRARVVRRETELNVQRYSFHLEEKKGEWVVRA